MSTAARRSPHTRVKRPESRQRELMEAAVNVFVARGYAATTVADITQAAGAAKGTFYRYFRSKEELIVALRDEFLHKFLADVAEQTGAVAQQGWPAQAEVFVDLFIEAVLENPRLHEVIFHSGPWSDKRLAVDDSPVIQWLANFIRAGIGAKTMQAPSPDVTAVLLFAASHKAVDSIVQRPRERNRIRDALVTLVHRTLATDVGVAGEPARTAVGARG